MPATGQIDYIEFPAIDLAKTKKFYGDVFGWKFEDYGHDYTSFNDGRLAGGFYSDSQAQTHRPLVVIYAEDLEAMEAKAKSAGGSIVKPVFSFPGGRRFISRIRVGTSWPSGRNAIRYRSSLTNQQR